MPGPYREKIFGIAIKIEAVPGVDALPGVADAIRVVGIPTLKWDYYETGLRPDVVTGQLGQAGRTIPAGRYGTIDIVLELRGAGAAYSALVVPECDPVLRMGAMDATLVDGVSWTYTTVDEGGETGTMYCWGAGKLYKLVGCVATLKFSAEAARRGMVAATITGRMVSDPVEAALAALQFSSVLPPLFHTSVASIGDWASDDAVDPLVLKSIAVDLGNVVTDRPSAGAADGLAGYFVSDRSASQELVVEVPALATFDPSAMSKAVGAALPLTQYQIGQTAFNRALIQTGRMQLVSPDLAAINAINTMTLKGTLQIGDAPDTGRELNLVFN